MTNKLMPPPTMMREREAEEINIELFISRTVRHVIEL